MAQLLAIGTNHRFKKLFRKAIGMKAFCRSLLRVFGIAHEKLEHPRFRPYLRVIKAGVTDWLTRNPRLSQAVQRQAAGANASDSRCRSGSRNSVVARARTTVAASIRIRGMIPIWIQEENHGQCTGNPQRHHGSLSDDSESDVDSRTRNPTRGKLGTDEAGNQRGSGDRRRR